MRLTEVSTTWSKVKECHVDHGNKLSWVDIVTKYIIIVDHGAFRLICEITKTDPRLTDQADFEDNYKD